MRHLICSLLLLTGGARGAYYYAPTLGVEVPDKGTWFWTHVQDDIVNLRGDGERIIAGFHVFRDGEWATVPALRRSLDQADPEARRWFQAVIEEIERQALP